MKVFKRPLAQFDLIEIGDYLEQQVGLEYAERFLDAAAESFTKLAQMPLMGRARPQLSPDIPDLRQWRIKGFAEVLIFYRPIADGVEIVRVLHSRRNIPEILIDEEWQE